MDVVAGVASVTQLTCNAVSLINTISRVYRNIQDAPALQHQRIRQLDRLSSTIQELNENPILSTSSLIAHLQAIIARIEELKDLLDKLVAQQAGGSVRKYIKAVFKDSREEHRILAVFIDLEKDKSALLLSIQETNTELSARIYNELTERKPRMQAAQEEMPAEQQKTLVKDKAAKKLLTLSPVNDSTVAKDPKSQDKDAERPSLGASEAQSDAKKGMLIAGTSFRTHHPEANAFNTNNPSQNMTGHLYESITFSDNADIHAGNIGESTRADGCPQKHQYKQIKAKTGRATAGDVYDGSFVKWFYERKK